MGIEEDMTGAFRFINFSNMGGIPSKAMLMMELQILKNFRATIDKQIGDLERLIGVPSSKNQSQWSGNSDTEMDPFIVLGVDHNSSKEEVDRAYKAAAKKCHPDKGGSVQEMAKVNAAYEVIKMMNNWK